eukprot:TRINITY_DN376_c0_g2_i5.p1 TRINITY_DN376_c0_g2~~TRINITY_DN376_c0_g2_i5.p1  ORF type:complete len:344 (-),score=62.99 TRINITY_DN376_c0_g2_i5:910-1941(-)
MVKNILVTGGGGFIGSNVVQHLVKTYPQYKIVNLDKLDYCSNYETIRHLEDYMNYKFVKGNILSADLVNYLLKTEKIDTIMHFAAQTHVDNSFGNSFEFTKNNILGTHVLLEAAKVNNISRFIHVSTDEVYGEILSTNAVEGTTVLEPTNPYAATKAGAEFLVKAYHRSFNLPTIITRGNNVYGPGQFPEKLIPKFICLLSKQRHCLIHGDGSHTRNFIYISDVVAAFDTVLHKGVIGETYNIGTDFEVSNLTVAKDLIKKFGLSDRESEFIKFVEDRKFNDRRYAIDSSKLKGLDWSAKVAWDEGLQKTIDWYKVNAGSFKNLENFLQAHPQPVSDPLSSLN